MATVALFCEHSLPLPKEASVQKSLLPVMLLAVLLAAPSIQAKPHGERCQTVRTQASFQIFPPEACTESPFGLCSEATLYSSPLRGTYQYSVDDLSVGAGLTSLPPSSLAISGEFVLETRAGTVIGTKTAIFDLVSGEQITLYNLLSGPYTGTLFASGFFDPGTLSGSRHRNLIWGEVCRVD
jgi:hypothetical protein